MMHVMAWKQQTMISTDGDLFYRRKYELWDMCAVLNGSKIYHLQTSATLNYLICQNAISLLRTLLHTDFNKS